MKHELVKRSEPGWAKLFDTEDEARAELLKYICRSCLLPWDQSDSPDPENIHDLLCTPCGCEFLYEIDEPRV